MEVDCVKAKILSTLKRSGYSISPTFLHQIQSDFLTNKLKSKDYLNTPIVLHDWTGLNIKICMRKQNIGLKNFIKLPSIKIDPHYYRSTHPAPLLGWFIPDIRLISTKSDPSLQIQHVPKIQQKKQIKKILENLEATRAQILIRKYDYAQYHYKNLQSLFETHQNFIPEVLDTFCSKLSQHGDPLTFNTQTTYQIQIFLFKIFWAKAYSEFHRTPIKPSNKDSIDKFVSDLLDTHIQTYLSNTIASLPHYLKDYIKMTISLCKPIVYSMASDNLSSLFIDNYNTNKNTLSASFQDYFYKQQSLMNSNLNALTHSMLTLNSI